MTVEQEYLPVEYSIRKLYDIHQISLQVYELFSVIFSQELALKEQRKENKEMIPVAQRRKSFIAFSNIEELSPEFQEAAGFSREVSAAHRSSLAVPDQSERKPSQESLELGPVQLTLRPSTIGKPQLPSIGSLRSLDATSSNHPSNNTSMDQVPTESSQSIEIELERPETGEKIYVPEEMGSAGEFEPLETIPKEEAAPPAEEETFIADLVKREEEMEQQESGGSSSDLSDGDKNIPSVVAPEPMTTSVTTSISNTYQGNQELLNVINSIYNPFSDVDYKALQGLADKVSA